MVRADSGYRSIADMDGTTICVLSGTTTELNLATAAGGGHRLRAAHLRRGRRDPGRAHPGQCQGWTSDKSRLAGVRSAFPDRGRARGLTILDETFSKEPLGPVVLDGDDEWAAAVDWAVIATIQAEEFGITTANVEDMTSSENLDILRFLGEPIPGEDPEAEATPFDPGLGLDADFAVNVISQVGNYGEIYDRTVGADSARARSGAQRPVHRRRPDLRSALPVMAIG